MSTATTIFLGTGRRKTSTARIRLTEGSGKLVCNGRDFDSYFSHENFSKQAYAPLLTVELREKIDVTANVAGGGVAGQAGADWKIDAQWSLNLDLKRAIIRSDVYAGSTSLTQARLDPWLYSAGVSYQF